MNTQTTLIPFHGDTITCIETDMGAFVAVKPICERLGLAKNKQIARLKRDPERWGGCHMVSPSVGGEQETYCIPRTKVFGWLATINVHRVKPEIRDTLVLYQNEADEVLDRHFRYRAYKQDQRIAQQKRMLWHAGKNLQMFNAKWQRAYTLMEMGASDYLIAKRCNWSLTQATEELRMMRNCGLDPNYREDMDTVVQDWKLFQQKISVENQDQPYVR